MAGTVCGEDKSGERLFGDDQKPGGQFPAVNAITVESVEKQLETSLTAGLQSREACRRLAAFGPNEISKGKSAGAWTILYRQFASSVVILLIAAACISFATGEHLQAIAILVAVIINAVVGFITEVRAKVSLESLEKLAGPTARVIRDGNETTLPAVNVVPGDIIILQAGSRVPADLRAVEAAAICVDESAMTGESVPVYKSAELIENEDADSTLLFRGTVVVEGRARGVVYATGDRTRLGGLGQLLAETVDTRTPLEEKLETLGKVLSVWTLAICAVLAGVGVMYEKDLWLMLETSIALAVAAIPEGLPVVATLALAVGTHRMVKERALIRQLAAVETLGSTGVICSDKTGTLTENKMMVTDIITVDRQIRITGDGYKPVGKMTEGGVEVSVENDLVLNRLLTGAALCNDAVLQFDEKAKSWHIQGDPTEGALVCAAAKAGLDYSGFPHQFPRMSELPFDLGRKRMSTIHRSGDDKLIVYVKGSPESVLNASTSLMTRHCTQKMSDSQKEVLLGHNHRLASAGLRVLAVAARYLNDMPASVCAETIENDLVFIGLIGMSDQPKEGVREAIEKCKIAGIRIVMLTGDQKDTAINVACDLAIISDGHDGNEVVSGDVIENASADQLHAIMKSARVLARVTPGMKLSIVRSFQKEGYVVAMTGDGVNDAAALRQANIGVAMGQGGTDLAREASNMVITDDNFSTIVRAVEQGRIIYSNIRRSIAYLLTAALASVITVAGAVVVNAPLPLTALQLLWLNFIMHIFPGLGIVLQPGKKSIMDRPPRDPKESLLNKAIQVQIWLRSAVVAIVVLATLSYCGLNEFTARSTTVALATISLALLYQAWSWAVAGQGPVYLWWTSINKTMWVCMALSYALLFMAIYIPGLQVILETVPLTGQDWLIALFASTASLVIIELLAALVRPVFDKRKSVQSLY